MDSGNSGSLQSSSGGDDELDSRCGGGGDSSPLSALLRQPPPPSASVAAFGGAFYGLQDLAVPPPLSHWSTTPAPTGAAGASPSPPSPSCHGVAAAPADQSAPAQAQPSAAAPPRGSRKRTRASRRAPTTVLTTDTSNFRAMVQEFTGIPAPPFAGASALSRFDHLFPSRSAAAAASLPPYLLRPLGQKLHASAYPPFMSPSTSSPAPASIAIAASTAASAVPSTRTAVRPGDGFQLASAPSALLGMQDHCLSFQSPIGAQLDGSAKFPAHSMFDTSGAPSASRLQDLAGFLGLAHGIIGSEATHLQPHRRDHGDELSNLVEGASVAGTSGCKARHSSGAGSAVPTAPLLERNAQSTSASANVLTTTTTPVAVTAAMRTQGVDSWICTSE